MYTHLLTIFYKL